MELKQKLVEKMRRDRERARQQRMEIEKIDNEEGFDGLTDLYYMWCQLDMVKVLYIFCGLQRKRRRLR